MVNTKRKSLWVKETPGGGTEYRKSSKLLVAMLPLVLAGLFYKLLLVIEGLSSGRDIIVILAYALVVLMAVLMLLVVMVSIIEYLRRFE